MFARLAYYLGRLREAPAEIVARKAWLVMAPLLYAPGYRVRRWRRDIGRPEDAAAPRGAAAVRRGARLRAALRGVAPRGDEARARIELVLGGRFPCLGFGEAAIPRGEGWHADPFHGRTWPLRYFARIPVGRAGEPGVTGDVKVPWELSRLQYLVWLAEGALLHEGARAAACLDRFRELVADWTAANPAGFGVNWACAMEVAIRGVNLAVSGLALHDRMSDAERTAWVRLLREHLRFLRRFPEISDVPGNHFLADLMGMALLAAVLDEPERDAALASFFDEAERQFAPEGAHLERAPVYHRLCLDMVAVVTAVSAGGPHFGRGLELLDAGLGFCRALASGAGELPLIADADDGHVLWFGTSARTFGHLEEIRAAWRVGRPAGGPSFDSAAAGWLWALSDAFGPSGAEAAAGRALGPVERTSVDLEPPPAGARGGFAWAALDGARVVMRVGEQGLGGRASHDHDDSLSIWLSAVGHDLIAEEGCFSYTLDESVRRRNLASRAHNLVQPLDEDRYAPVTGSVALSARGAPLARLLEAEADAAGVRTLAALIEGEEGRGRAEGVPSTHARTVRLSRPPDGAHVLVEVEDAWTWHTDRAAELRWHLGPTVSIVPRSGAVVELRGPVGPLGTLELCSPLPFDWSVEDYAFAGRYGASTPARLLRVTFPPRSSGSLVTRITLAAAPMPLRPHS